MFLLLLLLLLLDGYFPREDSDRVKYENIIVSLDECLDLRCDGIVIECRRKFKRR